MQMKKNNKVTIKIPRQLYNNLQLIIKDSGFDSVTDFVVYILRDLVATKGHKDEPLSPEDIERVKKRLRDLGYMD